MTPLQEFRQNFPMYNDMGDNEVLFKLYQDYYTNEFKSLNDFVAWSTIDRDGVAAKPEESFVKREFVQPFTQMMKRVPQATMEEFEAGRRMIGEGIDAPVGSVPAPLNMALGGLTAVASPLVGVSKALIGEPTEKLLKDVGAEEVAGPIARTLETGIQMIPPGQMAKSLMTKQLAAEAPGLTAYTKLAEKEALKSQMAQKLGLFYKEVSRENYPKGATVEVTLLDRIRRIGAVAGHGIHPETGEPALILMMKDKRLMYVTDATSPRLLSKGSVTMERMAGVTELSKSDMSALAKVKSETRKIVRGVGEEILPPYSVLARDPSGAGLEIWQVTDEARRSKATWSSKFQERFKAAAGIIKSGSESSLKVGKLLDDYDSLYDVPAYELARLSSDEKRFFNFLRDEWKAMGDVLEERGLFIKGRRLKSYFHRVLDKSEIYDGWKVEIEALGIFENMKGLDAKQTLKTKKRMADLRKAIDTFEKTGTVLYDYLPRDIDASFLHARKGTGGYSLDAVKAMDKYAYYYAKKIFDEPAVKYSVDLMKQMSPENRDYARWYLRRYLGLEKLSGAKNAELMLTSFEYFKDLGFNVRSAVVNSTQSLNTIIEIGPNWTKVGAFKMFTKEGDDIWRLSGHAVDVPGIYYGVLAKGLTGAQRVAGYLFNKVEMTNREVAYLGAYYKARDAGLSSVASRRYADDIVRKTQFIYGITGAPKMTERLGGSIATQFTTFPIRQLGLFTNWAKDEPKKLVAYLIIAGGAQKGLQELGLDMSNALGVGVDFPHLVEAAFELGKGDINPEVAWLKMRASLPKVPGLDLFTYEGSGIFPTGIAPAITTLQRTVSSAVDLDLQGLSYALLPVQLTRTYETMAALSEGRIETPEIPGTRTEGYPVRTISGNRLRAMEEMWELGSRTLLIRPEIESKARRSETFDRMLEKRRDRAIKDAAKYIIVGDSEGAKKVMTSFGITMEDSGYSTGLEKEIVKLWKLRNLTDEQRLVIRQAMNEAGIITKGVMGLELP